MNPLKPHSPIPPTESLFTDSLSSHHAVSSHIVQFYEGEDFLGDEVTRFLAAGLEAGEPLVVIATEPHRRAFCQRLKAKGFDVEGTERLTLLDATETLSGFMVDSMPDWERFELVVGSVLQRLSAGRGAQRLRLYGEMVDVLFGEGNSQAAIRLEEFWNAVGRTHSFTLLCAYVLGNFSEVDQGEHLLQICGNHTHVRPTEQFPLGDVPDERLRAVALLQQRARALETEIQRRQELEAELRDALNESHRHQQELKDFVENAAEGLHWVGADGIIQWANRAELELLGYSSDEYVGHHISEFHADSEVIRDILRRLARNETLRDYEARLRTKDGSTKHVLISSNVCWVDGRFHHTRCFTRDNTARKHAHDALLRLQAFTARLSEAQTFEEVVEAVVRPEVGAMEALSRGIFLLAADGRHLELACAGGNARALLERYPSIPLDAPLPMAEAVRQSAPVFLHSQKEAERYGDFHEALAASRVKALACLPLVVEGKVVGALGFGFGERHLFSGEERAFFIAFANQCAQALDRARLHDAESRSRRQAEAAQRRTAFLSDASALLSSLLEPHETLASISRLIVPRMADGCVLELASGVGLSGSVLVVEHVDSAKASLAREGWRRLSPSIEAPRGVARVLATGEPQLSEDCSSELDRPGAYPAAERDLLRALEVGSSIIVPMSTRGRTLGAILLVSSDPKRRFEQADLEMAVELGCRIALAIDNALLYQESREANRRKDEFLAMLGHELRNPLAPILTALQLLQLRGVGGTREVGIIDRQVRHLVRLVDDLLDVARITRGKVELKKEPIELGAVLAKAVELASPLCEQRSHHLSVDVPHQGLLVQGDPVRLAQVLANLLTNAAKYTDPGGKIRVTARREGMEAVVSVKDNGSGIPPDMLSTVFELFVQGDRRLDRSQGGLGIGLTVARSLVELHGGTISARSPGPGQGSEFVVRLPVLAGQQAPERDPEMSGLAAWRVSGSEARVLIADDNKDAADLLADALRAAGHEVVVAEDGLRALSLAATFRPAVALLDIGLPGMDGYELARKLREADPGRPLRLVAVTGYGQGSDQEKSREAGFDLHLTKPVELRAILALVGEVAALALTGAGSAGPIRG